MRQAQPCALWTFNQEGGPLARRAYLLPRFTFVPQAQLNPCWTAITNQHFPPVLTKRNRKPNLRIIANS